MTYSICDFKIEENDTDKKAEDYANTSSEVLRNIVGVVDAHSHQDPS